MRKATI
jgi:hypothetical protein